LINNNSMKKLFCILSLFLIIGFYSCKKDKTLPPVNMGYNYFPINIGHWVIYQVDSIVWDDFTHKSGTFHYKIKELIESEYLDNSNRITQRIERYIKRNDTSQWTIKNIWHSNRTASTAEKVEENIRFVKLIFPTQKSSSWNGNGFNTLGEQTYKYSNVDVSYTINSQTFDSTAFVLQKDEKYAISNDYAAEIYARNIGMIYKRYTSVTTKPTGEITKGVDYSYSIISYGN